MSSLAAALADLRADRYHVRAIARSGDRLHLYIRTFILRSGERTSMGGTIDLVDASASRLFLDLGA